MKIFGPLPWGPALDRSVPFVPTPVGQVCSWCAEPILAGDEGSLLPHRPKGAPPVDRPIHKECQARTVLGSVAHQAEACCCYGGKGEDDPALSKRDAARAALAYCEWKNRDGHYDA